MNQTNGFKHRIYITEEGQYILTRQWFKSSQNIIRASNLDGHTFYRIIKKLQSYDFQKKFLTKHPERANIIGDFGFNEKIKKEFPALVTGNEWGFFDLKND